MSGISEELRHQEELYDRDHRYGFRYSSDNTFGEHERKAILDITEKSNDVMTHLNRSDVCANGITQ